MASFAGACRFSPQFLHVMATKAQLQNLRVRLVWRRKHQPEVQVKELPCVREWGMKKTSLIFVTAQKNRGPPPLLWALPGVGILNVLRRKELGRRFDAAADAIRPPAALAENFFAAQLLAGKGLAPRLLKRFPRAENNFCKDIIIRVYRCRLWCRPCGRKAAAG